MRNQKAQTWIYCELFYAAIDNEIFRSKNEFIELIKESFPGFKTNQMKKSDWTRIRRKFGKPRLFSPAFIQSERQVLEEKRRKIRAIIDGTRFHIRDEDGLPEKLPKPLAPGMKVYARIRSPRRGFFAGIIDAVMPGAYRLQFQRQDGLPNLTVSDLDVLGERKRDVVSITYFLEMNRTKLPSYVKQSLPMTSASYIENIKPVPVQPVRRSVSYPGPPTQQGCSRYFDGREEKVGNFPVRMLVIIVKLAKLLETKRSYVQKLTAMNNEVQRLNLYGLFIPDSLKRKYAKVITELNLVDKVLRSYMSGIDEYDQMLTPQLPETSDAKRPAVLNDISNRLAPHIVKFCNAMDKKVQDPEILKLITAMTSLMLQIRAIGKKQGTAYDVNSLRTAVEGVYSLVNPKNRDFFQKNIQVQLKHIVAMMLKTCDRPRNEEADDDEKICSNGC
ncbi:hypothetical protein L596_001642 [Steinernema carpocapsae]|uniref:DIRP domain-containing protein n=1 Tax=Steinernema carpocapsae TaxID=34508 RepID=A0A4U8UNV2_STECR|nr:hypothetical protein L596_001642 [Steinernema carpocapsae]